MYVLPTPARVPVTLPLSSNAKNNLKALTILALASILALSLGASHVFGEGAAFSASIATGAVVAFFAMGGLVRKIVILRKPTHFKIENSPISESLIVNLEAMRTAGKDFIYDGRRCPLNGESHVARGIRWIKFPAYGNDGHANRKLVIPDTEDTDAHKDIATDWVRDVETEFATKELMDRLGLITPDYRRTAIRVEDGPNGCLPVYVDEGTIRCYDYALDKTPHRFMSDDRAGQVENWDPVFHDLLADIASLCRHQFHLGSDSLQFTLLPDTTNPQNHVVRFCGHRFAYHSPEIPLEGTTSTEVEETRIVFYLQELLGKVLIAHNGPSYSREFRNQLLERYKPQVIELIKNPPGPEYYHSRKP